MRIAHALAFVALVACGSNGSKSPETNGYPGGEVMPIGGPPVNDGGSVPIPPPLPGLCKMGLGDPCGSSGSSDAAAAVVADSAPDGQSDGEAGVLCPPLDTTACGIPVYKPLAPCPTYNDVVQKACAQGSAASELMDPCDGLQSVWVLTGIDSGAIYYFDSATKDLVGIAITGNAGITCVGGTPGFNPSQAFAPSCPGMTTESFEDAGACAKLPGLDASAE